MGLSELMREKCIKQEGSFVAGGKECEARTLSCNESCLAPLPTTRSQSSPPPVNKGQAFLVYDLEIFLYMQSGLMRYATSHREHQPLIISRCRVLVLMDWQP